MVSTSGHKLIEDDAIAALTDDLMPLTSLITPNLREAEVLTDHPINNVEEMKSAALELLKFRLQSRPPERRITWKAD